MLKNLANMLLKYLPIMLFTFPIMSVLCSKIIQYFINECSIKIPTVLLENIVQVYLH